MNKIFFLLILNLIVVSKYSFAHHSGSFIENNNRISLPKILSENDKKIYLEINKLQILGNWKETEEKKALLKNKILLGYVEYDRLMHPNKYKATYVELMDWLENYKDYPAVMKRRVYNLLKKRVPQKEKLSKFKKPDYGNYLRGYGENTKKYNISNSYNKNKSRPYIDEDTSQLIITQKYNILRVYFFNNKEKQKSLIYHLTKDADKKFFKGSIEESLKTYSFLINEIKIEDPNIFFNAGINAYRLKYLKKSKNYFNKCNFLVRKAKNNYSPKLKSSCLYWEARLESSDKKKFQLYSKASKLERSLYGQLAIEKLKKVENFNWNYSKHTNVSHEDIDISKYKSFKRLISLSELNAYDKADLEMRNLYSKIGKSNSKLLFFLSEKLDLAAVQIRLGEAFYQKDYRLYMRGMYPTPEWSLENSLIFDKALIYALISLVIMINGSGKYSLDKYLFDRIN